MVKYLAPETLESPGVPGSNPGIPINAMGK